MKHLIRLLVLVSLLLCCTAGCSFTSEIRGHPGPEVNAGGIALPATLQARIPFPDETLLHETSVAIPSSIPGNARYMFSDGAYVSGDTLVLPTGNGELEWAIYRLSTYGYPALSVEVNLVISGGEAYCGVANFSKGCWEFSPGITKPTFSRPITSHHISAEENVYIAVAAYDASTVTVNEIRIVLDQPDWDASIVVDGVSRILDIQLFAAGPAGEPRLVTLDNLHATLHSATSMQPQNSGDWESVVAASAGELDQLLSPLSAGLISGRPAMAYYRHGAGDQLCYTYATVAEPAEEDWVTTHVGDPVSHASFRLGFCEQEGDPRLLYTDYQANSIWLASSATDAPGSGDWTLSKVRDDAYRPSLAVVNGQLACAYYVGGFDDAWVTYARATTANPVGPASWIDTGLCGPLPFEFGGLTELIATPLDASQAPIIVFLISSFTIPRVASANDPEPGAYSHWDFSTVDQGVRIEFFRMEMKMVSGRPAMVYYANNLFRLQFAQADTANPDSAEDWQITTLVSGVDIGSVALAEVGGQPAVAYYDEDEDAVIYAYWAGE